MNGVPVDEWAHLTVTYDGTDLVGYLNGVKKQTVTQSLSIADGDQNLFIGSRGGTSLFDEGALDQVEIYQKALSDRQFWRTSSEVFKRVLILMRR